MIDFAFVILGLLVSLLVGLTGMGGGALTTPILVFLGIPAATAVGSDLAFTSMTRAVGAILHGRKSNIDFKLTGFILIGSVPATVVVYFMLPYLKTEFGIVGLDAILAELLGTILICVSLIGLFHKFVIKKKPESESVTDNKNTEVVDGSTSTNKASKIHKLTKKNKIFVVAIGAMVGLAVQLTSVGSGTILIFFLMFLARSKNIVGTDIFHGFILTSLGSLLHLGLGDVNPDLALSLALGGIPGIFLGVRFHSSLTFSSLRYILNTAILGAGTVLVLHILL